MGLFGSQASIKKIFNFPFFPKGDFFKFLWTKKLKYTYIAHCTMVEFNCYLSGGLFTMANGCNEFTGWKTA